jgi:hypothetical protein
MKSSTKILIGVVIAISFLVGFFIGITVNSQKPDKQELAGTIGKISSKEMKASENNLKLRSDLLSNETMLKNYRKYFTFHYSSCSKLCEDIDFAIKTSENVPEFREDYSMEIENVKQYRQTLEQAMKNISQANTSLQQLSQSTDTDFNQAITNATKAIDQIKDKQSCLPVLVESIEKFMTGNNPYKFSNLIKAHDMFAINQLVVNP